MLCIHIVSRHRFVRTNNFLATMLAIHHSELVHKLPNPIVNRPHESNVFEAHIVPAVAPKAIHHMYHYILVPSIHIFRAVIIASSQHIPFYV